MASSDELGYGGRSLPINVGALRKILELEHGKGYTDSAVFGGLDRFLHNWADQAVGVITTRNIFKWNNIYFKPSKPQVLLFMDNLTSNSIGKHIFHENIDEEIQKGLIDLFGGALQSVSMMTEEIISKSGELKHLVKDKRSILFEPYHNITGVLICDYNSINLRHKLEEATLKFADMHPEIIQTGPINNLRPINRVFTASVDIVANIFKEIE